MVSHPREAVCPEGVSTHSQKNWQDGQRVTPKPLPCSLLVDWGGGTPEAPQPPGVTHFGGDLAWGASLSICLFVGLSVGMEGGVAHGRVPAWGERWEGGLLGGGKPVVTHTPKLNSLRGFGRGASKEVPHPGVDLSSSLSGFCSGLAQARGPRPGGAPRSSGSGTGW